MAKRYNLEYRAADATASPYLQLAMLVYAGLTGIQNNLPAPFLSSGDLGTLTSEERSRRGIGDLPRTMGEALDALEADDRAMSWMGPVLAKAYLMHKRGELAMSADKDMDELCSIYARMY